MPVSRFVLNIKLEEDLIIVFYILCFLKTNISGVLGNGMSMGYSAIAIPDIKQELLHHGANSTSLFDSIETSSEQLNWFGNILIPLFICCILGAQLYLSLYKNREEIFVFLSEYMLN